MLLVLISVIQDLGSYYLVVWIMVFVNIKAHLINKVNIFINMPIGFNRLEFLLTITGLFQPVTIKLFNSTNMKTNNTILYLLLIKLINLQLLAVVGSTTNILPLLQMIRLFVFGM